MEVHDSLGLGGRESLAVADEPEPEGVQVGFRLFQDSQLQLMSLRRGCADDAISGTVMREAS